MNDYYKYPTKQAYLDWDQTKKRIAELLDHGKLVIFGAGIHSIPMFYRIKENDFDVECFCDNDNLKWGKKYCEKRIISPAELLKSKEQFYVLIGADCYAGEIQKDLYEKGFPTDHIVSVREYHNTDLILPRETLVDRHDLEISNFFIHKVAKNENPFVTVRIKVYNEPLYYIRRAIESILAQTFTAFHLVIIANGASREICEMLSTYADSDDRIKIITYQKNGVVFDSEYQTKYFCKLDADDYYEADFLERAIEAAEAYNAEIVVVNSKWYVSDNPGQVMYTTSLTSDDIVLCGTEKVIDGAIKHLQMFTANWAKLIKSSLYFSNMDITTDSVPDSVVSYLGKTNTMVILPEILHYWTRRNGSVSNSPGSIWDNWRDISLFHVYERIYLAFVKIAIDYNVFDVCNAAILGQNFMTQLKSVLLTRLQSNASFQPDIVAGIIDEIKNSNSVVKDLLGFPEYKRFRIDLSKLEIEVKDGL